MKNIFRETLFLRVYIFAVRLFVSEIAPAKDMRRQSSIPNHENFQAKRFTDGYSGIL